MKKNISSADRVIRVLIAAVIAILYFTNIVSGLLGTILLILAGIFLLTSFISFCPIYFLLGIKTSKTQSK